MSSTRSISLTELETLTWQLEGGVATVTLDRPERHNALNRRGYDELTAVFEHAQQNDDVRCVVVTGNDPSFCAGDDVKELMAGQQTAQAARPVDVRPEPTGAAVRILECDKPVIAAVNGAAVGWGMELALFADIRVASQKARFGELFVKRGLVSDVGGIWRLPRLVGLSRAAELLFTGDIIDAAEAERIGLVSRVVPHEELLDAALELASRIAANPPLAVRFLKEGLRRSFEKRPARGRRLGDPDAAHTLHHRGSSRGRSCFLGEANARVQGALALRIIPEATH